MKPSTTRIILRVVQLLAVIPVFGYINQSAAEADDAAISDSGPN